MGSRMMAGRARPPRASAAALSSALALAAAGCGGATPTGSPGPTGPTATTCPIPAAVAAPTFARDVLPALRLSCGARDAATCHGTPDPRGHVSYAPSLSAAAVLAGLVGAAPASAPPTAPGGGAWLRVAPGEPARSWLLAKVTQDDPGGVGQAYGNRMPLQAPNLCDATVRTLTDWIAQGAVLE